MPGPSWGARGNTKLEDDALFREIGGQLAGLGGEGFDYSQWQRTHQAKSPTKSISSERKQDKPPPKPPKRPDTVQTGFTVSTAAPTLASLRRIGATGSACHHGARAKPKNAVSIMEDEERRKKVERLKVLQLRIRARKQTLADYRKRYFILLDDNIKLKESIDQDEGLNHDAVKKLLRKYEKFRGGIATLNDKFVVELAKVQADLEKIKIKTAMDLECLQEQVDDIDVKLKEKQKELNVLMNYKDKEYPLKSLRIAELGKELVDLKSQNEEEIDELQRIVDSEMDKYRKERFKIQRDITVKVTDGSLRKYKVALSQEDFAKTMDPSWEEMAMHNMVMRKEMEVHRKEADDLEAVVQDLDSQVKQLLKDPKTSIRQQMFPQFYPSLPKCTPDMEVVLDIPTQQWLPI